MSWSARKSLPNRSAPPGPAAHAGMGFATGADRPRTGRPCRLVAGIRTGDRDTNVRCYAPRVSRGQGTPEEIRRRVAGWRAAEQREREVRRDEPPLDASAALDAAQELYELAPDLFGQEDALREREVLAARAAWAKLRIRSGWRPGVRPQR